MNLKFNPAVLIILDGFGIAMPHKTNAISAANTPFFNNLINTYPTTLLEASGASVGLPYGEVGNSEVGHLNIGSGRLLYQNLPRINNSIDRGEFFKMDLLLKATKKVKATNSRVHLIGLIGNGGVHSYQRHLLALLELCKRQGLKKDDVIMHLFLDGRDTAKDAGKKSLEQVMKFSHDKAILASLSGRFYAMDRNKKWDRIEKSYNAITRGKAEQQTKDPLKYLDESYKKEVYDEEFPPTVIVNEQGKPNGQVEDGDVIIFFNFRADRARQLTQSFVLNDFKEFERLQIKDLIFITFTEYEKGLPVYVLFPTQIIENPIARVFSENGLRQYHIAETEKYAHVTFFLNGLIEKKFPGEDRELIPSPAVAGYDEKPEMSASEVTDKLIQAIQSDKYTFLVVNYANGDMVGHTGNLDASIKAVETLDLNVSRVVKEVLNKNGVCFIVSDHGNAEELVNLQTMDVDKEHSIYPVPFIVASNSHQGKKILTAKNNDLSLYEPTGVLADVAPTILESIGLEKGPGMKGGLNI